MVTGSIHAIHSVTQCHPTRLCNCYWQYAVNSMSKRET